MSIPKCLSDAAAARGLKVVDRGQGHFQITGGPLLINYYPLSKKHSAYVAGTTGRRTGVTPEQAVEMAFLLPPIASRGQKDDRKGSYRAQRRKLLKFSDKCHWCNMKLTLDTSTMDHVIPLHRGGLDNANNRVLACEPCNSKRGHDMPELRKGMEAL
jgi:hypothetical protein